MLKSDLQDLYETISDPEVMRYIEEPYSEEQTKEFLKKAGLVDSPLIYTAENDEGDYIGYVIYHKYDSDSIEIGWVLKRAAWGKGYANELTRLLISQAKCERKEVVMECVSEQEATIHIAEKFGFSFQEKIDGLNVYRLKR